MKCIHPKFGYMKAHEGELEVRAKKAILRQHQRHVEQELHFTRLPPGKK